MDAPYNKHGGLTLVPLPGFERVAQKLKTSIEEKNDEDDYRTPVDIATVTYGNHDNGEPYSYLTKEHIGDHDVFVIASGPATYESLGMLYDTLDMIGGRRASRITVMFGYFPLSRSEKPEKNKALPKPGYMIRMMETAAGRCGVQRIICADPHANITDAGIFQGQVSPISLKRRLLNHTLDLIEKSRAKKPILLVYPDASAADAYKDAVIQVEERIGERFPNVVGVKIRTDSYKTKLVDVYGDVNLLSDSIALMIDDEIARGTSMCNMSLLLRTKYGAKNIWAEAPHCVMCGGAPERFLDQETAFGQQLIDQFIVSDTIPIDTRPAVQKLVEVGLMNVLSWVPDQAKIINREHWGLNTREVQ